VKSRKSSLAFDKYIKTSESLEKKITEVSSRFSQLGHIFACSPISRPRIRAISEYRAERRRRRDGISDGILMQAQRVGTHTVDP